MKFALAVIAAFGVGLAGAGGVSHLAPAASDAARLVGQVDAAPQPLVNALAPAAAAGAMGAAAAALGVAGPKSTPNARLHDTVGTFSDVRNKLANSAARTPPMRSIAIPTARVRGSAPAPMRGLRRR